MLRYLIPLLLAASPGVTQTSAQVLHGAGGVVPPKERARIERLFSRAEFYGAYASSGEGPEGHFLNAHTVEDAQRIALGICEGNRRLMRGAQATCTVKATLVPTRAFSVGPTIVSQAAQRDASIYQSPMRTGWRGAAFAISGDGGWGLRAGFDENANRASAMSLCEGRRRMQEPGRGCRIIAVRRMQ